MALGVRAVHTVLGKCSRLGAARSSFFGDLCVSLTDDRFLVRGYTTSKWDVIL